MAAYNFMKQFEKPILSGEKCSTIRRDAGKRNPQPGDALHLFTGMRTKECRKLAEVECDKVQSITIREGGIVLGGNALSEQKQWILAQRDGLMHLEDFFAFFRTHYGLPFTGVYVKWWSPKRQRRLALVNVCHRNDNGFSTGEAWVVDFGIPRKEWEILSVESAYADGGGCSVRFDDAAKTLRLGRRKFPIVSYLPYLGNITWDGALVTLKTACEIFAHLRSLVDERGSKPLTRFSPISGWSTALDAWKKRESFFPVLRAGFLSDPAAPPPPDEPKPGP